MRQSRRFLSSPPLLSCSYFVSLGCFDVQTKIQLFEILRSLEAVPGVPIETGAEVKTPATLRMPEEDEDMPDVDTRPTGIPVY